MPFRELAKEIIQKSFRSAVFIDDKMVEAYNEDATIPEFAFCKDMFNSFRNNESSLDIYKYKNFIEWEKVKDYHLKRKDLLILDWKLNEYDNSFLETLRIIEYAIKTENMHYICIYTDEIDIQDRIIYKIYSYFSGCNKNKYKKLLNNLEKKFEENSIDIDNFKTIISPLLKELSLPDTPIADALRNIKQRMVDIDQNLHKIVTDELIKKSGDNSLNTYRNIGYILNGCEISNDPAIIKSINNNTYIIENTLLNIHSKENIEPADLFEAFSNAILNYSANFMTILGLELRNQFLETSAFMSRDIAQINEMAFFYSESLASPKESFYDFLQSIWKEQAVSFMLKKELKVMSKLEEYKKANNIDEKLALIQWQDGNNQKDLARLNYHYNILLNKRENNYKIRFGDIFRIHYKGFDYDYHTEDDYLLNITANCDCAHPEKIKYQYYFVQGNAVSLNAALSNKDREYNSYIICNNDLIAIEWKIKPISVFIPANQNSINKTIEVNLFNNIKYLKYISTIKENYTQRITNAAFSFASRVGIDFAGYPRQ